MGHEITKTTYYKVFAALMALLVVTVVATYIPWGSRIGIVIAMSVAIVKATLVVLYFMHIKGSSGLSKVFVIAGLAWLAILMGITLVDYHTRPWLSGNAAMTVQPQER
ncbi:MAG TPA: cytochrome C oxidase subunit IV family protein [Tepidisphaeraceae bacterium]|jgi:cytochrome c oxidase subunit 4|nr:cytochrome C oxidase subunit IV family protein [Tepidisphaeraceae bacterium]